MYVFREKKDDQQRLNERNRFYSHLIAVVCFFSSNVTEVSENI